MHHASLLLHFFLWIEETLVRTKLTKVWLRKQVFVWTLKVTGSAEGAAEQHSYLMGWWRGTAPRKWFSLTARKAAANLKMILIVQKEFSERLKNAATSSEWSVADERWWYLRLFKNLSDSSRTIDCFCDRNRWAALCPAAVWIKVSLVMWLVWRIAHCNAVIRVRSPPARPPIRLGWDPAVSQWQPVITIILQSGSYQAETCTQQTHISVSACGKIRHESPVKHQHCLMNVVRKTGNK